MTIVIPCGAKKLSHPARAGELYTGSYHRACLRWAMSVTTPDHILILSAKYGLLKMHTLVAPYSQKLGEPGCIDPALVAEQATGLLHDPVYVVGGRLYTAMIKAVHPSAHVIALRGGMGHQLRQLKQMHGRFAQ